MPPDERKDFCEQALRLIGESAVQKMEMLHVLKEIPAGERAEFCSQVIALPIGCARTFGRLGVMRELKAIPAQERDKFLSQVFTVLEGIADKSQATDIMDQLRLISPEKRKGVCDFISRMPKEMDRNINMAIHGQTIMRLLAQLTDEERQELLSYCAARPSLKIFDSRVVYHGVPAKWLSWFCLTRGRISWIRPAMKFCKFDQCDKLLEMCDYIPQELRAEFLELAEFFSQFPGAGEDDSDLFAQVMLHREDFKERLYDCFIEDLNQPDQDAVWRLTELILNPTGFRVLSIYEDHRLAQAAIQVKTQLEMAFAGGNRKNPYTIYQQLKEERKRAQAPLLYPVMHQERPFLFCPRKVFEGAVTVVAPEEVVAKCKGFQITKDRLLEFAGRLRGRMSPEIEAAVRDLTGYTVEALNENLQDPFFNILHAPSEAGVPLNQAMLCAIITSILDQPDEVADGEVLSPREKGWLSTFSTINNCQQGKVEGLLLVYRLLPVEYQYGVEMGKAPAVETAIKFIKTTLQTTIDQTLSQDNALMKELTGAALVKQLPHQATYLKNRLGFYLGRPEGVVFDLHTHTLYDPLIDQSNDSLVSSFCRHFTVEQAIGSIIQRFENLSENPPLQATVYNGIVNLFEGKLDPSELFTLDPWALTEKGALALLDSLGIFNDAIVEAVERGEETRGMELFASLPETVKNRIFFSMWQVCGSPLTGDPKYGENGFYGRIEGWSPEELREKRVLAMRKVL